MKQSLVFDIILTSSMRKCILKFHSGNQLKFDNTKNFIDLRNKYFYFAKNANERHLTTGYSYCRIKSIEVLK